MMFSKATLVLVSLFAFAAAKSEHLNRGATCQLVDVRCCKTVVDVTDDAFKLAAVAQGLSLEGKTGLAGLHCKPLKLVGEGGHSCHATTLCCQTNGEGISLDCAKL